ncbi:MAG: hypothetical protein KDD42_06515 [Bdellovibrionales bacterium]|nr:hypothetical protein [Bdellovibrionales bacterium]
MKYKPSHALSAIIVSAIFFAFATQPAYSEEDSFVFKCLKSPSFVKAVKDSVKTSVLNSINTDKFSDPKVRVNMKRLSGTAEGDTVSSSALISGLHLEPSGHPDGLAFGLSGDVSVNSQSQCVYEYRVSITASGRDVVSGDKVTARTSQVISFTTPPLGRLKRIR